MPCVILLPADAPCRKHFSGLPFQRECKSALSIMKHVREVPEHFGCPLPRSRGESQNYAATCAVLSACQALPVSDIFPTFGQREPMIQRMKRKKMFLVLRRISNKSVSHEFNSKKYWKLRIKKNKTSKRRDVNSRL